jgi:hypothetical protein
VTFGKAEAQIKIFGSSQLSIITPPQSTTGEFDVTVVNPGGQHGTLKNGFVYQAPPPPVIGSINPTHGPQGGGTQTTISGQSFVSGCKVLFGGMEASVVFASSTQLSVITPQQTSAGVVKVEVVNPDLQAGVLPNAFQYDPPPIILKLVPNSGPVAGGTQVSIQGQNFAAKCKAIFGRDEAATTFNSANQLSVITPAQENAGLVSVKVVNPDEQSAVLPNGFQYENPPAPAPVITSISPSSGTFGTIVTIRGQNFEYPCTVLFGKVPTIAPPPRNGSELEVSVPGQRTAGPVDVTVINPGGESSTLTNGFQYNEE